MATLFLFHRDLRVFDNTGLREALKAAPVIPVFIFTPSQILPKKNPYFSPGAVQFMIESLVDLNGPEQLAGRLNIFYGEDIAVLTKIHKHTPLAHFYTNQDYTKYAIERDARIAQWCKKNGIAFHSSEDYPLLPINDALREPGQPYKKYTPFFNKARSCCKVHRPQPATATSTAPAPSFIKLSLPQYDPSQILNKLKDKPAAPAFTGGRKSALARLKYLKDHKFLKNYATLRDRPAIDGTSRLSPHIKFGTISIREVYWFVCDHISPQSRLVNELFWRDFYLRITYFYPDIFAPPSSAPFANIPWNPTPSAAFTAWKTGHTGVPLVDAAMRQLNTTGWMHNRTRMVTAMFLTKNLLINWREGERYFATKLIDYDPSSNNGGWQWSASTGVDGQPYFRVFNPYRQAQRFDPEAAYIKEWLPELAHLTPKQINDPDISPAPAEIKPIVNVKASAQHAIEVFRQAKK